ncbi:MAG: hypothetical protein ACI9E1_000209 [Cryomorphaceae bacterium]
MCHPSGRSPSSPLPSSKLPSSLGAYNKVLGNNTKSTILYDATIYMFVMKNHVINRSENIIKIMAIRGI